MRNISHHYFINFPTAWIPVLFLINCQLSFAQYQLAPISGQIVDSETQFPLVGAVVNAAWKFSSGGQSGKDGNQRAIIEQVRTDKKGRYKLRGRSFVKLLHGWKWESERDPTLTIYYYGYKHEIRKNIVSNKDGVKSFNSPSDLKRSSVWDKKVIKMERVKNYIPAFPQSAEWLVELGVMKKNIEKSIALYQWRNLRVAMSGQAFLLRMLDNNCLDLPKKLKKRVCFDENTELGRFQARGRRRASAGAFVKKATPPQKSNLSATGFILGDQ